MKPDSVAEIVIGALAVVGALIQLLRTHLPSGGRRRQITNDLELWKLLPEESAARGALLDGVDASIKQMIQDRETKRRDPSGVTLGVLFLAGGVWMVMSAITTESGVWWRWVLAVLLLTFGGVGLSQDVIPRERDEKGRVID